MSSDTTPTKPAPADRPALEAAGRLAVPAVRTERQRQIRSVLAGAVFALAACWIVFGATAFTQYEAALIVVYAIAALGQDLLMGRSGQISLGAAAFLAIGAYMTAGLDSASWAPFPVPVILSALGGGAVGLLVGITGLRFRGLYLALSTLALQFLIAFAGQEYQGSGANAAGFTIPVPHLGSLTFGPGKGLFLMLLVVLVLIVVALTGFYRRAPGRAWAAIRQSETAAAVAGVDVRRWKLLAFVASSAVIAIGGSMYAYVVGTVSYVPFSLDLAISILTIVFVGGLASVSGSLIGSVFVVMLPYWLQSLAKDLPSGGSAGQWLSTNSAELAVAIYGLALLLVLLFERDGLAGIVNRVLDFVSRRWARMRSARVVASEGSR